MNWGRRCIPWLLAAVYVWHAMRSASEGPAAPDGGQHATNGALIHDYLHRLADGEWVSPIKFAHDYLIHYPAISVGYHPPLFHGIEAGFFTVFGVSPITARLAVAVCAGLSLVLLFWLIERTHQSTGFAAIVVVVFAALRMSQQAASDVMLEFPSLMFALAALHCLVGFRDGFTWTAALLYAIVSAAAIWTKQHTVFLGLVPFFLVATTGRWRELARLPIWGGALLFGAACLTLAAFMNALVGDDYRPGSQVAASGWAQFVIIRNLQYYAWRLGLFFSLPAMLATVAACVAYIVLRLRRSESVDRLALYAAWAAAVLPVPLVAWQHDERYLFAGFPAFLVLLLDLTGQAAARFTPRPAARWGAILAAALLLFGIHVRDHITHSYGPAQAAEHVWNQPKRPARVLVCGRGEYQFIFTIRCLAGLEPAMVILRGSKLPPEELQPATFDRFAHEYGLEYVVFGDDWKSFRRRHAEPGSENPWQPLVDHPTEHMELELKLPMENTFEFMEGDVLIYRYTNPSPDPRSNLDLRMNIMNRNVPVDLSKAPAGE